MQKLTSIILINPSVDLFPLSSYKQPDFSLPVVNEPILSLNLRWISPISSKIILVSIEDYVPLIKQSIKYSNIDNKIEIHKVNDYEGTFQTVSKLVKHIQSENVLIYKGNFYSKIEASVLSNYFYESKAEFLSFFCRSPKEKFNFCSYKDDNLFFYTEQNEDIYKINPDFFDEHDQVMFSKEFKLLQIYILNKKVLNYKPTGLSFKNEIFPAMIDYYRIKKPIKMMICEKNDIIQLNTIENYSSVNRLVKIANSYIEWNEEVIKTNLYTMFEYKCKNKKRVMFKDQNDTRKSVVGVNLQKTENVVIYNSILGNNVKLGNNTKIGTSIIMDGVTIGNNCVIEKCKIGYNASIADDTVLNGCIVACNYSMPSSIRSKDKNYHQIDF